LGAWQVEKALEEARETGVSLAAERDLEKVRIHP
jgi:hypothetical protein